MEKSKETAQNRELEIKQSTQNEREKQSEKTEIFVPLQQLDPIAIMIVRLEFRFARCSSLREARTKRRITETAENQAKIEISKWNAGV